MSADRVSAARMRALVEAGEAWPLLAVFSVGPTRYRDCWWHVPAGADEGADYRVAGEAMSAELDALRQRVDRIDAFDIREDS